MGWGGVVVVGGDGGRLEGGTFVKFLSIWIYFCNLESIIQQTGRLPGHQSISVPPPWCYRSRRMLLKSDFRVKLIERSKIEIFSITVGSKWWQKYTINEFLNLTITNSQLSNLCVAINKFTSSHGICRKGTYCVYGVTFGLIVSYETVEMMLQPER